MSFPLHCGRTVTLNIYSQVGLVTLVGLVSKNGILIVEFANVQQERGLSKIEAVKAAAATRLRPIVMTSIATWPASFPLTLVTGPGAVRATRLALWLVGGMSIGTLFTLFAVPSIYVLLARDHRQAHERISKPRGASQAAAIPRVGSPELAGVRRGVIYFRLPRAKPDTSAASRELSQPVGRSCAKSILGRSMNQGSIRRDPMSSLRVLARPVCPLASAQLALHRFLLASLALAAVIGTAPAVEAAPRRAKSHAKAKAKASSRAHTSAAARGKSKAEVEEEAAAGARSRSSPSKGRTPILCAVM